MSINRVQKLLFSEYCDFEDLVLIESPFAQTTRDGRGLRQVHLGLTPSKLILATDILPPAEPGNECFYCRIDPEIETFELIAIYPVECVTLSVYRRKRRQAIKARFCNNRVLFFELGGFERRGMFWNLWCEKIKFLCGESGSSKSETSVATSSTGSSLYLVDKKIVKTRNGQQHWFKFSPHNFGVDARFINDIVNGQSLVRKWTDRYLYMGRELCDNALDYLPIVSRPLFHEFVKPKKIKKIKRPEHATLATKKNLSKGDSVQVNRFGSGILEGCSTGLYLPYDDAKYSESYLASSITSFDINLTNYEEMAEMAVLTWEYFGLSRMLMKKTRIRHRRRYGFAPKPQFLYGLGPWHLTKGDRVSVQLKRALSDINVYSSNFEKELKLSISKRQLSATVSCPVLIEEDRTCSNNIINAPRKPPIFFWTPGYWYRPISAKDAYNDLQKHLKNINTYHEASSKNRRKRCSRRFLRRLSRSRKANQSDDEEDQKVCKKHKKFMTNILTSKQDDICWDDRKHPDETTLQHLKRILKVNGNMTAWDFDSTTLAHQLTLIDKELFLKIPTHEMAVLLWQQSSKNAPNVAAMIAFSYRISCLVSSEILRDDCEKLRARLLARFINVANKCHRISNFHSCRTILCGLQNPAVYRLKSTWAYVRKKHASKYQSFEFLCRLYRDPRMPTYQKTFFVFSQRPPFMPYIGHIIAKLLDKVPQYKITTLSRPPSLSTCSSGTTNPSITVIKKDNIFSKLVNVFSQEPNKTGAGDVVVPAKSGKKKNVRTMRFKGLYEYFKPLNRFEDTREEVLVEVTELLEKSQLGALQYNFPGDDKARDFLLKARHYDDQDNFFNSLRLEPCSVDITRNNKLC